jgi:hypothetical protein
MCNKRRGKKLKRFKDIKIVFRLEFEEFVCTASSPFQLVVFKTARTAEDPHTSRVA